MEPSFTHSFSKHLFRAFYKETTLQDTGESNMSKTPRRGLQETPSLEQKANAPNVMTVRVKGLTPWPRHPRATR